MHFSFYVFNLQQSKKLGGGKGCFFKLNQPIVDFIDYCMFVFLYSLYKTEMSYFSVFAGVFMFFLRAYFANRKVFDSNTLERKQPLTILTIL